MYGYYKDETYFDRLDDLQINCLFNLISRHVQVLENKILQKKSGWKGMGVFKGLGWLAGGSFYGWLAHEGYRSLTTGDFGDVKIPDFELRSISSFKATRSERKEWDKLKANGAKITWNLSPYWYYRVDDLSEADYKKVSYLAFRLASWEAKKTMLTMGVATGALTALAIYQFYKVTRYAERLVERLERDKRILAQLQNQKDVRLKAFYSQ